MILAAGLGTRLRPLTSDRPKALVEVAGRTLLEMALSRLRSFGIDEVIVNVHHHAEMVIRYLEVNRNFGMHIVVSREEELLDTGGGLKQAAHFLGSDAGDSPFLLHNVDVLSNIDFAKMIEFHLSCDALATLAIQNRPTSRPLLFDDRGQLCGRRIESSGTTEVVRPADRLDSFAFSGIHVLSPRIFEEISEQGAFSIIPTYLRLAAEGKAIVGFRADGYYWRDLGRPEHIYDAAKDIADGVYAVS